MNKGVEILFTILMFWNIENFFSPTYYKSTQEKSWGRERFNAKRDLISKTILYTKDEYGRFPCMIGVCEIENKTVLMNLIYNTPLNKLNYKVLHKESLDKRGIDVALLYKSDEVEIIEENYFPKKSFFIENNFLSRYILHAKAVIKEIKDTLHIFVNHWPSKVGGEKGSMSIRMLISNEVKKYTDSLLKKEEKITIILMGDFNDTPESRPIKNLDNFINLTKGDGSYKWKNSWEKIDQFLINRNSLNKYKRLEMNIMSPDHLLQEDKKFLGKKIKRTFSGPRYIGGASDHLPIILQLYK